MLKKVFKYIDQLDEQKTSQRKKMWSITRIHNFKYYTKYSQTTMRKSTLVWFFMSTWNIKQIYFIVFLLKPERVHYRARFRATKKVIWQNKHAIPTLSRWGESCQPSGDEEEETGTHTIRLKKSWHTSHENQTQSLTPQKVKISSKCVPSSVITHADVRCHVTCIAGKLECPKDFFFF